MKTPARRYLEFAALCLLAIALLWWFGRKLDWTEVQLALRQANWYLLSLAVVIISVGYGFRAFRWGVLLSPLVPARWRDLFAATTLGFSGVFLLGRAGEVVRPAALTMRDPRVRPSSAFVTIFIERIYDMMAILLMFAINLLWFTPPRHTVTEFSRIRISGAILLAGAICGIIVLTFFRRHSRFVIDGVKRLFQRTTFVPARLAEATVSLLHQLAGGLRVLVDARELAVTVGWTVMVWLCIGVAYYLVFRAFGLPFGVSETIFVLGWSLAGSLVPTPGGAAGAFHAVTAAGLILLGIARETAAAVSIVLHFVGFGPAILFGLFYFVRGDMNISRMRSLLASQPEGPKRDNPLLNIDVDSARASELETSPKITTEV